MEDLRLAIIVLGVFSILGILIHGLWTIRKNAVDKNKQKSRKEPGLNHSESSNPEVPEGLPLEEALSDDEPHFSPSLYTDSREPMTDANLEDDFEVGFDEDGIGQVRTVAKTDVEPPTHAAKREDTIPEELEEERIPEPPSSLMKNTDEVASSLETANSSVDVSSPEKPTQKPVKVAAEQNVGKQSFAEKAKQFVSGEKKERVAEHRFEPKLTPSEEQIRMDFDNQSTINVNTSDTSHAPKEDIQEEVLVLNVKMPEGKSISGAALLPALLTLGFKFGEQNVFHRHAASNGKGPKLFSLANMFKPGTFDVDAMETFETQGLSLFMILPIEGEPQQVFNMMHNAARKLADEFGAQILDARRSLLTKQSLQQYVEKIREFERKRMINRN
ncbi:cell division protein ZipA [Alteromonas sp. a30]|uniref:cell division protein ZipA n=1 Tax=Alteromonas sp. a30 TaxID=2730917 RepID=UPI002282F389|nr:cell division protein ZipA [Alteromonas sp. a30]MCY7293948.1 cell division protein ZipA [Alteromonas sp. a30]